MRGIVAGATLRRLVCKAVARQYADLFKEATAPYQYALQTRAGTEALAHTLRVLTEEDPDVVIMSLDGVGAYDHVSRAAFMEKLAASPKLHGLIPLVAALYGSDSHFLWWDAEGQVHTIDQGEGGEQGCPLMPALYSLAQHDALVEADGRLLPGEQIFSFLDDLYIKTCRARARSAFDEVAGAVECGAGVRSNLGKLRAWSSGGGRAPE